MGKEVTTEVKTSETHAIAPQQSSVLQRSCACGGGSGSACRCPNKTERRESDPLNHDFAKLKVDRPRSGMIQPKLQMSTPGDQYEVEADEIADRVLRMPDTEHTGVRHQAANTIQRACEKCDEEEEEKGMIQPKFSTTHPPSIQRQEATASDDDEKQNPTGPSTTESISEPEEESGEEEQASAEEEPEESVQGKSAHQGGVAQFNGKPPAGNGQPMANDLRNKMEQRFGYDFSQVRLHSGSAPDQFLASANALAATHGGNIYSGSRMPVTSNPRLLAHELTHVVQQGKAKPINNSKPNLFRFAISGAPSVQYQKSKICGRASTQLDFPDTYIKKINVSLNSPNHPVTLEWDGPNKSKGKTGPINTSPGAGNCGVNCDDKAASQKGGSRCTPKGNHKVYNYACAFTDYPAATNVTYFDDTRSGIALHYFDTKTDIPRSHGCVRIASLSDAQLIYDNSKRGTDVEVTGTWSGTHCWASEKSFVSRTKPKGKTSKSKPKGKRKK